MKILTKEEEEAHYNATLKGGFIGGFIGLAVGGATVWGANRRFQIIRNLTLPMKAFLISSSITFAAIITADRSSRSFEWARDPQRQYRDRASLDQEAARANESALKRSKDWAREHRYPIIASSWVASMGIALGLVGRNPYLTGAQKLVQARVYAQGLTLAVLLATAALEVGDANKGKGRWETIKIIDPNDPEHKHLIEKRIHHEAYEGEDLWRDMVVFEERKMNARKDGAKKDEPKARWKEGKDKITHDSNPAHQKQRVDAEEFEKQNQERQASVEASARTNAAIDHKVKGRGDVA